MRHIERRPHNSTFEQLWVDGDLLGLLFVARWDIGDGDPPLLLANLSTGHTVAGETIDQLIELLIRKREEVAASARLRKTS